MKGKDQKGDRWQYSERIKAKEKREKKEQKKERRDTIIEKG